MNTAEILTADEISERLDAIPALPAVVYELNRVINDPMSSISEVEAIMSSDQGLTTKVLRLANSAYYSIPGGVSNVRRAIAYIGYDVINQLVLSTSIVGALATKSSSHFDLRQFWKHSLGVAMAAEATAQYVGYSTPSDLFTCGLIHDMGKIATYIIAPEVFARTVAYALEHDVSLKEAESQLGTVSHTLVGQELAAKWRLPAIIQASAGYHHEKDVAKRPDFSGELNLVIDVVYLANVIIHGLKFGNSGHDKVAGIPKEVIQRLHLEPPQLKEIMVKTKDSLQSAESFLAIIGG